MSDFKEEVNEELAGAEAEIADAFGKLTPAGLELDLERLAFQAGRRSCRTQLFAWRGMAAASLACAAVLTISMGTPQQGPPEAPIAGDGLGSGPSVQTPRSADATPPLLAIVVPELPANSVPLAAIERAGSAPRVRPASEANALFGGL